VSSHERRPATPEDLEFLAALYTENRAPELAAFQASDEDKARFCRDQFELQRAHYTTHCPDARHEILLIDGSAVGRIWVDWRADEVRLLDVLLSASVRSQGLGTALLEELMHAARERALPVTLHVEHGNARAKRLYERLGFRVVRDAGTHAFLQWTPEDKASSAG